MCVCVCRHVSYSRLLVQLWNWSIPPCWRRCTCIPQNPECWPAGSAGRLTAAAWIWEPGPSRWPRPATLRRDAYGFWLIANHWVVVDSRHKPHGIQGFHRAVSGGTFPPGDGGFGRSARLAGKHSCVPLRHCLVRWWEGKSGGHTCNTERMRGEEEEEETGWWSTVSAGAGVWLTFQSSQD